MKKLSFLLFVVVINCFSQEPSILWGGNIGGPLYEEAVDICSDNGNIYITGGHQGNADFDMGAGSYMINATQQRDAYVIKYDTYGNIIWGVSFAGNLLSGGTRIDTDSAGNVYSVGQFFETIDFDPGPNTFNMTATPGPIPNNDVYISKLDSNGNFIWAKQFTGQGVKMARGFFVDSNGNVYITGIFNKPTTFSTGSTLSPTNTTEDEEYNIYITKFDSSGNFVWAKQISAGNIGQRPEDIFVDNNGFIYICGIFNNPTDFDPNNSQFTLSPLTTNGSDIFVLKLDNNGNFIWAKSMGGGTYGHMAKSLVADNSGNLYLTGHYSETIDFNPGSGNYTLTTPGVSSHPFLLKLDTNGNFQWAKDIGGVGVSNSVAISPTGQICISGYFWGTFDFSNGNGPAVHTSIGGNDAFIAEYNSNGNLNWVKCIGGTGNDRGASLSYDSTGNVFVQGDFFENASINTQVDNFSFTSNGSQDIFLLKISQTLNVDDFSKNGFVIYPNPSQNELHLKFPEKFSNGIIVIYSMKGQVVKKSEVKSIINIANLDSGHYLLKMIKGKYKTTTKFVVK